MEGDEESWSKITKKVTKPGVHGRKPCFGWKCTVKVWAVQKCGAIESDYLRDGVTEIILGNANWPADKAIEECLETMHVKEEASFEVKISPNEELNLNISLEECTERGYIFEWSHEEKLQAAELFKSEGVELFNSGRIEHAFYKFGKALKMLILMDLNLNDVQCNLQERELLTSLYNNLSRCQLHFGNYEYAIELCSRSLSICSNVKALFRRALANIELKDYEKAENDLVALLKIEPKNKVAMEKYKLVRELDKKNRENYESIVKNMFR